MNGDSLLNALDFIESAFYDSVPAVERFSSLESGLSVLSLIVDAYPDS